MYLKLILPLLMFMFDRLKRYQNKILVYNWSAVRKSIIIFHGILIYNIKWYRYNDIITS